MIGWGIVILALTPEERDNADQETLRAATLAQWETGAWGIEWIERMAQDGKAVKMLAYGYPNRYTAKAADVLHLLNAPPELPAGPLVVGDDYALPANWRGAINLYADRVDACPADLMLTIDAWDLS